MKLDHICHPDHKLSYKKEVNSSDEDVVCAACLDVISSEHYCCAECKFFLHKFCVEQPSEFTHPLHPKHHLHLLPKSPYDDYRYCDYCGMIVKGFIYHCAICDFDLDIICAFPDGFKLKHVCHPGQLFTYKKVVKRADKGLVCAACVEEILSEHYCCAECNLFLHRLCAERPSEFTHSLHLHPLRLHLRSPYGNLYTSCSSCGKMVKDFIYHCAICNFDLDFTCAFPDGLKPNHVSHPDHKLAYQKVEQSYEACVACLDAIQSEHYRCDQCNFFIHKLCSERPLEFIHPLHPLRLLPKAPYAGGKFVCYSCDKILKGFVYHCSICEFNLDLICAFPDGSKLNHVCHPPHPLTYEKVVKKVDEKEVYCAGCLDAISSDHYSCVECKFFVHKICVERPPELIHPLDPHPLHLLHKSPHKSGYCNACVVPLAGFVYRCKLCDFDLDFICAFSDGSKLSHICHPEHTLTLENIVKKADKGMVCSACLEAIPGPLEEYYSCRPCNFFLHKLCSQQPIRLKSLLHPHHPLNLYDTLPRPDIRALCNGCHKRVKGIFYHCSLCKNFFLHFKCAFPRTEKLVQNFKQLHHHPLNFQHRPARFSCDICSSRGGDVFEEEDQSYSCSTCGDFWIHKSCAFTTLGQRYKNHKHPLSIVQGVPEDLHIYDGIDCDVCGNTIFSEEWVCHCARCRYFAHFRCMTIDDTDDSSINILFDIVCAALPAAIMHKTHEHPLFQMKAEMEGICYSCDKTVGNDCPIFKCISCDVYVSHGCAMNTGSIRHRWDREHPILLRFPPHDHPDHFMCDMCEELIHPKHWLYSCFECDASFHADCPKPPCSEAYYPNVKFGGKVQISYHPHILKFIRKATLKTACDRCGTKLESKDIVFECETCYYCICCRCGFYGATS